MKKKRKQAYKIANNDRVFIGINEPTQLKVLKAQNENGYLLSSIYISPYFFAQIIFKEKNRSF